MIEHHAQRILYDETDFRTLKHPSIDICKSHDESWPSPYALPLQRNLLKSRKLLSAALLLIHSSKIRYGDELSGAQHSHRELLVMIGCHNKGFVN